MTLLRILFKVAALSALAVAIPTSILEDLKDVQLHAPIRANKVKRAQEFIMFGNQQNRAVATNRNEKRASEIDDNSLSDDEEPLPQVIPQSDDTAYENNHLSSGRSYPYTSRDLYYSMLLRYPELIQNSHNDPGYNFDYPSYSMMDGRYKRDTTKSTKETHKPLYRSKREQRVMNPEELLALMRMTDNDKDRQYYRERTSIGWPVYESEVEDFPGVDDDSTYENEPFEENGSWYSSNNGMEYPLQFGHGMRDGYRTGSSRPHKRFMVSKRRMSSDSGQFSPYGSYESLDGIPLHRRFLL
ncbi:hypothetical protein O3M35_008050 [Rhynocoris fuscipes]|uniref:Uncharacterized protein n=1 Tax=Rhynocoris fuscipes TaxID=488301 RepID=A0AAW1D5M9_9HEMI